MPAKSFVPARITTTARLEIDDVCTKANQHLRRGLPANTAIDIAYYVESELRFRSEIFSIPSIEAKTTVLIPQAADGPMAIHVIFELNELVLG